jgi:hypothetical protein
MPSTYSRTARAEAPTSTDTTARAQPLSTLRQSKTLEALAPPRTRAPTRARWPSEAAAAVNAALEKNPRRVVVVVGEDVAEAASSLSFSCKPPDARAMVERPSTARRNAVVIILLLFDVVARPVVVRIDAVGDARSMFGFVRARESIEQ